MTTQVKKAFQPIVDLIENAIAENPKVQAKSLIDQIIEMTKASVSRGVGSTFIKDATGATVAIFDYYFKRWMPLVGDKAVEFGAKQKTATGYNSMCKEGVSNWTKQQNVAKKAERDLLKKVASGEIAPSDIPAHQAEIEATKKAIVPTELGFATVDEVMAYLAENGVEATAPASEALVA